MFDEFYGLKGKPFQLTPDAGFYFQSGTHRKALSYLGYGLAQGEGFIVITGEVGSGKSTLVAHLRSKIDPDQLSVCEVVTSALDEEEIIHVVAQNFGLEIAGHDKATALGMIEGFLHEEAREGRRCLLVVDEAQNLSIGALEELRMLSNFQLGAHPLLQTLLLGQPEFRRTLQGSDELEQLRQRVIATHHLEGMDETEVAPYILHRLKKVGWDGRPAFEDAVFGRLHEETGGIPRKVNQVANRLLLLGAIEEKNTITAQMLESVLAEMATDAAVPPEKSGQVLNFSRQAEVANHADAPDEGGLADDTHDADAGENAGQAKERPIGLDPVLVDSMLAERDAQIAELQQAVVELANQQDSGAVAAVAPDVRAMQGKIAELESKMIEQERTIRQTLTMLIEWIEGEFDDQQAAA